MKPLLFLLLITAGNCYAQTEFQVHSNGLIYDETTMTKLGRIVDSLNVRFRTCDLPHPYRSFLQGKAAIVSIPNKAARKLLSDGLSLEEYTNKFPKAAIKNETWVYQTIYETYDGKSFVQYSELPGTPNTQSIRIKDKRSNRRSDGWVIDSDEEIAFFLKGLRTVELPSSYGRLVQYVDCMIDTTAEIYFPVAKGAVYQRVSSGTAGKEFIDWADSYPARPKYPSYDENKFDSVFELFSTNYRTWDSSRLLFMDGEMVASSHRKAALELALEEGLESGNSDAQLEFYVARYLSKDDALNLKRSRRVIGNCSQDQSPRYHAMEICMLAAETAKWDIFLRSHLDIMNDRFERQSDGSYAWAARQTYLKELEELDINAIDLLLGTGLRVSNVSEKHYWGNIGRLGRALAETTDRVSLEGRLINMIEDTKLDPFNRIVMAYLFSNYANNLDENSQATALGKLETAMSDADQFMKVAWKAKD